MADRKCKFWHPCPVAEHNDCYIYCRDGWISIVHESENVLESTYGLGVIDFHMWMNGKVYEHEHYCRLGVRKYGPLLN